MSSADGETITMEARQTPETVESYVALLASMLPVTGRFPGCRGVRVVQHKDEPARLLLIERWETEQSYKDYVAWRASRGELDALRQGAVGRELNVWPKLIRERSAKENIADDEGVSITFELRLKPEVVDSFLERMTLEDTASRPGFLSVRLVQHKDDPSRVLFVERWESEAAYRAYVDWQTERGVMDALRDLVTAAETNVWPTLLASV